MNTMHRADGACVGRSRSQQWADARLLPTLVILERCGAYFVDSSSSMGRDRPRQPERRIHIIFSIHSSERIRVAVVINYTAIWAGVHNKIAPNNSTNNSTYVRTHRQQLLTHLAGIFTSPSQVESAEGCKIAFRGPCTVYYCQN